MNSKSLLVTFAVGILGSLLIVGPASATLIDVIYNGLVVAGSSTDDLGLFGPAGGDLTGDAFTATFHMDTSKGIPLFTSSENYIHGGTIYGADSPMITATLEINGKSVALGGDYNASVQAFLGYPGIANQQSHVVADASNTILLDVTNAHGASLGNIPFTIDVPLVFNFDSSDIGGGLASFHSGALGTSLSLGPTELIYEYPSPNGAVPEPSIWTMLLFGFAALGAFGYRNSRRPQRFW
jgi:PEP-CTERM motif